MNQTKKTWDPRILTVIALGIMWVMGFFANIAFFAQAVLLLLPVCGVLWAYLFLSNQKKSNLVFFLLGIVGAYFAGLLTNGFSFQEAKLVFHGISFTDPFAALYPLLCLPFVLPLLWSKRWKLSRTTTVLIMSLLFALAWIAWEVGRMRFYDGPEFVAVFSNAWKEIEQLLVDTLLEVKISGVTQYTEAQAWLFVDRAVIQLPAFGVVFALVLSYVTTLLFRLTCVQNKRTELLPNSGYAITVSFTASVLYVILFFLSAFSSNSKSLIFYGVVQNFLWMLLPVFCYLQIKRTLFRILHRQMDTVSWIYFGLALFVTVTDFQSGLSMIAAFGAFGQITRYLLWNAQKKYRP